MLDMAQNTQAFPSRRWDGRPCELSVVTAPGSPTSQREAEPEDACRAPTPQLRNISKRVGWGVIIVGHSLRPGEVDCPCRSDSEGPPSSRDEGLRLLHGLATNLATSLQTPQEA